MTGFRLGQRIAWTLHDGNVMVGVITRESVQGAWGDAYEVKRVDGSVCHLDKATFAAELRVATYDDILAAVAFYAVRHGAVVETSKGGK